MLLFLLACLPVGSDDKGDSGVACTEMAMASVTLTVENTDSDPIEGVSVTWAVDGGAPEDCESSDGKTFVCGYERVGEFELVITAPGYVTQTLTRTLALDASGCHVAGLVESVALEQGDCTEEVRPSVIVRLWSALDTPVVNPQVSWAIWDSGEDPQPCTGEGMDWWCGEEVAGDLSVSATADGYQVSYALVEVEMDEEECHVMTREVEMELLPAQ